MNITENEGGTATLTSSSEDMQKVICLLTHTKGVFNFTNLFDISYNSELHPDNCLDTLKQVTEDSDVDTNGHVKTFNVFVK